jgi:hypothetical protein
MVYLGMGQPKRYVYLPGDVMPSGWVFVSETSFVRGRRDVVATCPVCGLDNKRSIYQILSGVPSCGCDLVERKATAVRRGTIEDSAVNKVAHRYRETARKNGTVFELTDLECGVMFLSDCYYCGTPPCTPGAAQTVTAAHIMLNGVDRVDPANGYTTGNTRPCCKKCNYMKGSIPELDMLLHIEKILKYQG